MDKPGYTKGPRIVKNRAARRWSDHDHYFGPFTYARDDRQYRPLALVLSSAGDDGEQCQIRLSAFGHTFISALPAIIKPSRTWVDTSKYEWASERGGYWQVDRREYGIFYHHGFLQVFLGRQTHDSSTTQDWSKFLTWTQWRHVRHSYYGANGEHVATIWDGKSYRADPGQWERERELAAAAPAVSFEFDDFDGERIIATTKIEEREWRFGTGWFKWLSLFRKPKISRYLVIRFSAETGKCKGSWKGGTIGHSIEMLPSELHEEAFRRYCAEHNMTFIREASDAT
jgi:hypothetical protein